MASKAPYDASATKVVDVEQGEKTTSSDIESLEKSPAPKYGHDIATEDEIIASRKEKQARIYARLRPFILGGLALLILGWWISATILPGTRDRWIPQTFWAWFFILVIVFRFVPNRVVTRPVSAVWMPLVQEPWFKIPYAFRLGFGFLVLVAMIFGSAFGFPLQDGTTYADRGISVLGLFVFQAGFVLTSSSRSNIPWPTVIVGLIAQQAVALFVLKSQAGYAIFNWIGVLASDFLNCSTAGVAFFTSDKVVEMHFFILNVLGAIIFFIAFVQMMYYLGVMQWIIAKFAWFFFKIMNISGAEAVVAAASPWIGQGESACLVKPYVDLMTASELHLTMTSGFSTIAGSVFAAYVTLFGVAPSTLITASVMSIPASIAISKIRMPELEEPVTRGNVVVDRGNIDHKNEPANALHAFSQGATFGLIVAGQILANVLTILSLVAVIDGFLTWIGRGFSIDHLTLSLIFSYLFYPVTFLMGVPRPEILRVSQLLATKLIANEFVAYGLLKDIRASQYPLSQRADTIAAFALCGFANFSSLGIQIGVLGALARSQGKTIARIAPSAMICGFISTMQAAAIAGMLI